MRDFVNEEDVRDRHLIVIVGCGGAGITTINRLHHLQPPRARTIAVDTDKHHLDMVQADSRILIARSLTRGLGAGGAPDVGRRAAEMARSTLEAVLEDAELCFVTAGLGGGTGTGSAVTAAPLIADEVHWLQYMREEEKLARDVYLALYAKWKLPVFSKIAASEQKHMDAIGTLLARYGVADPAAGNGPGVFDDETIQALSATLMKKGVLSMKDALEVGVIIEVTDIDDLDEVLGATTRMDIRNVYTNLRQGSVNHLAAFTSLLSRS